MLKSKVAQVALALGCFLLPFIFYPSDQAGRAAGSWTRGAFEKEAVTALAIGGDEGHLTRYAVVAGRGVFRNTDDFYFWASKSEGLPSGFLGRIDIRGLATSPANPRLVYAAVDNGDSGGLYRSTNGGATWALVGRDLASPALAVVLSPQADDDTVYAALRDGLYRSNAVGWAKLYGWPAGVVPTVLAVDPRDPEALYVGTQSSGLWHTRDGGATWQIAVADRAAEILAIAVDASSADGAVYLGTTRGLFRLDRDQEQITMTEVAWFEDAVYSVAFDPYRAGWLYAGLEDGVYRSSDGGAHWEMVSAGQGGMRVWALAFDAIPSDHLYVGTGNGVWRCTIDLPIPPAPTASPTPSRSATPTLSPTATASSSPTLPPTSTPSPTPTASGAESRADTRAPSPAAADTATMPATLGASDTPTATSTVTMVATATPTVTPVPPSSTPVTPTSTPAPPTSTPRPPTSTPVPPTDTPRPPMATPVRSTSTPVPPTATLVPATATPAPTATLPQR